MNYSINILVVNIILLYSTAFNAKVLPKNGASIHYNAVYFEENPSENAHSYQIYLSKDSLFKEIIPFKNGSKNIIPVFQAENLQWGTKYYWRVNSFDHKNKLTHISGTHSFNIVEIKTANFDEVKVKVNSAVAGEYSLDLISIDNTRTIFDKTGNPVWTMPLINEVVDFNTQIRDIKLTQDNTITFLTEKNVFEIDFEGNVLWKGPENFTINKGDTITFHHDFTKDANGNYYVLGKHYIYRKLLQKLEGDVVKYEADAIQTDSGIYKKVEIGMLLKFDKNQKLLWFWDSNDYLKDIDLNFKKTASGFPNFNTHSNAFSINELGTFAYFGMRDFSRIVKIDIKTKKVVASYGEKYPSGEAHEANDVFKSQHDANATNHNTILILNNNGARGGGVSSVIELKDELKTPNDSIVLWKFDLKFDTLTKGRSVKGGNVTELPNRNLLVCAGELNRIFEVSRVKKVIWDAFIFSRGKKDTLWQPMAQYRAHTIKQIFKKQLYLSVDSVITTNNNLRIAYNLYNTGNVADSYLIEITDSDGTVLKALKSVSIDGKSSSKNKISLQINKLQGILIKVTSTTNPFITFGYQVL